MKTIHSAFLAATLGVALAFTISCTSGGDGNNSDANCGGKPYDTSKYGCVNNELVGTCGGSYYNPENQQCVNGEIQNGTEITFPSSNSGSGGKGNDIANYRTVRIGDQIWMAENLNYAVSGSKCYGEGAPAGVGYNEKEEGIYVVLSDEEVQANCEKYGRLYSWVTAMALPSSCNSNSCTSQIGLKHRGICPSGWHIPSKDDWEALIKFVNDEKGGNTAYKYLKANSGWNSYAGNGTDDYSFKALPGGRMESGDDYYEYVSTRGQWWSASMYDVLRSRYLGISGDYSYNEGLDYRNKNDLLSVRCIKD